MVYNIHERISLGLYVQANREPDGQVDRAKASKDAKVCVFEI